VEGLLLKDSARIQNGCGEDAGPAGFDFGFNIDPETAELDSPSVTESAFPPGQSTTGGAGNGEWSAGEGPGASARPRPRGELMNLGQFEALPPFDIST